MTKTKAARKRPKRGKSEAKGEREIPPAPSGLVTRRKLAELLGVHMQTVTKWERDGMPIAERGGKGRPSLYSDVAVRAWMKDRDEAAKGPNGPLDFMQTRAQKEYWQAQLAEQQHRMRGRELIPASEVQKMWGAEVAAVRAVLLSSYVTHADRVYRAATLEGLAGVEAELKAIAHEALRELSTEERPLPGAA